MTLKKIKYKYHLTELWALIGFSIIIYYVVLYGNLPGVDLDSITSVALGAFLIGFFFSLPRNWTLLKPLSSLDSAFEQLNRDMNVETNILTIRQNVFELPSKRAFWMMMRFITGGCAAIAILLLNRNLSILHFFLLFGIILLAGATSSILTFFSMEKLTYSLHNKLHQLIEHKNREVRVGKTVSIYKRLYFALFTLILLMILLFGSLPMYHLQQFTNLDEIAVSNLYQQIALHVSILFIFFLLFTLLLGYYLEQSLTSSIQSLTSSMSRAERCDLATRTPVISTDEIGTLSGRFNVMMQELSEIFGKVRQVSDTVTLVADRLSSSTVAMSEGVELQATSTDTTASSMAQMQASITEVADSVNILFGETEKTSTSIFEMASSIDDVASNIESLTHSVDTTSTSIEEMNVSIKQVAENSVVLNRSALDLFRSTEEIIRSINQVEKWAIESSKLSNNVTIDADRGHKAVLQTIEEMEKIHKFFQTSGEVVQNLGSRSEQIGKILTVIDDVSSQTNLLALNAAIISAQAGERGKEFSVVADEIRDLAEKATTSTKEIAHLIDGVQMESIKAVQTMDEGARLVAEGVKLTHRAGDVLKLIIRSSTESAKMTHLIEDATAEQVGRSQEISKTVEHLKMMSDQTATATKEQKIGIAQIMHEAENMRDMTQQVRSATEKQARESRSIAQAVSEVKEMVERIHTATTQQKTESMSVLEAVEIFKDITLKNVDSMVEMDKAVDTLASQVRSLENQVSRFQV